MILHKLTFGEQRCCLQLSRLSPCLQFHIKILQLKRWKKNLINDLQSIVQFSLSHFPRDKESFFRKNKNFTRNETFIQSPQSQSVRHLTYLCISVAVHLFNFPLNARKSTGATFIYQTDLHHQFTEACRYLRTAVAAPPSCRRPYFTPPVKRLPGVRLREWRTPLRSWPEFTSPHPAGQLRARCRHASIHLWGSG